MESLSAVHIFPYLCLIYVSLSVCSGETVSSSFDSLSPGSEGAGAISGREVFDLFMYFNANVLVSQVQIYTFDH